MEKFSEGPSLDWASARLDEHGTLLLGLLDLPRDAAAHQVAQGIDRFIRNAVVDTGAAPLACHQTLFGQHRQVA